MGAGVVNLAGTPMSASRNQGKESEGYRAPYRVITCTIVHVILKDSKKNHSFSYDIWFRVEKYPGNDVASISEGNPFADIQQRGLKMNRNRTDQKGRWISPIAVDMGATRTGCLNLTYREGEEPAAHDGFVVMVDASDITLSQASRRAKRHQRRGYTRARLARRLLYLILDKHYGIPATELNPAARIQLQSLLTRRGYSFESADETLRETIGSILCHSIAPFFSKLKLQPDRPFLRELERLTGEADFDPQSLLDVDDTPLREIENPADRREMKAMLKAITEAGKAMIKARDTGVRHRTQYFNEIRKDFELHKELRDTLRKHKVNEERFLNLVCNLSNLQIKPLRRYFNDITMKEADRWEPERLQKFLYRWIRSWHTEKGSSGHEIRLELLKKIQKTEDIVHFLESVPPEHTIPPYEDQNNRHPPQCRSLRLDAVSLDRNFPGWQKSLYKLIQQDPMFGQYVGKNPGEFRADSDIEKILEAHRRSHQSYRKTGPGNKEILIQGKNENSLTIASILLQRFLDRSRAIDPYHLREQLRNAADVKAGLQPRSEQSEQASQAYQKMKSLLGESDTLQFLRLAERYYRETEDVRRGLWTGPLATQARQKEIPDSHNNETLFFRCDAKTGSKQNNREVFVGAVLGVRFDSVESWEEFLQQWKTKKIGRSSLRSICERIEMTRKKYGELFASILESELYRRKKDGADEKSNDILRVHELAQQAADCLAEILGHSDTEKSRYNNPFSIAQLYNLIETDRSGFSSVCRACAAEDQWRSQTVIVEEDGKQIAAARATKLSADTGRPFDGQLGYLLDRIAGKIAEEKLQQLESIPIPEGGTLYLPILVEQNTFSFRHDLSELKKRPKKERDALLNSVKKVAEEAEEKAARIRKDTGTLCPYTGKEIGSAGEYDHIVPRSLSTEIYGTVFDAEINLIYCSTEGNRQKGNRIYTLENLNEKYLKGAFGTADIKRIQEQIRGTLNRLKESSNRIVFDRLPKEDRRDLRHALFDPELRGFLFDHLMNRSKSRVNGTQLYFARLLKSHLQNRLNRLRPDISLKISFFFFDHRKDSLDMYRKVLADVFPQYRKSENQGDSSHIIDAAMVFACALGRPETSPLMASALTPAVGAELNAKELERLIPATLRFLPLKRREKYNKNRPYAMPLFDDSIYGEKFLPIIVTEKGLRIGYHLKNSIPCSNGKAKGAAVSDEEYLFSLLKPFLLFKRKPVDKELSVYRSLAAKDQRGFLILPIDKKKAIAYISDHNPINKDAASALKALRYTVKRCEIGAELFNQNGKLKVEAASVEELAEKLFAKGCEIKIDLSLNGKSLFSGKLQYPGYREWQNFLMMPPIKTAIQNGTFNRNFLDSTEGRNILKTFFKNSASKQWSHQRRRIQYGLSLPATVSGGIRIKRQAFDGTPVFQLMQTSGSSYSNMPLDPKKGLLPDEAVYHPVYIAESLSPLESVEVNNGPSVRMDEFRQIDLQALAGNRGIQSVQMAPGSIPRPYLRIDLDRSTGETLLGVNQDTIYNLKARCKLPKDSIEYLKSIGLPGPRDQNILITKIAPDTISISYTGESHNKTLRELYARGRPV